MRDATVNPQSGAFCGTPAAARRQGNGWARWNLSLPRPLSFCLALRAAVLACVAATLASCSSDSGRFRIEGRFRNLNRGEFYVYSPDGGIQGRDTIPVVDGRFAYEATITDRATFVLIFPNYSEQPVFGQKGKTATISGDASHLREMEIEGTDDNELMTKFRQRANRLSPPEVKQAAEEFVRENPTSPVSRYLVSSLFVETAEPDYARAAALLAEMCKADPDNGRLALYRKQVDALKASVVGASVPQFSAKDIYGNTVTRAALGGKVNVVCTWASWSYDSHGAVRRLCQLQKDYGSDLAVVGICLDARPAVCRSAVERDSIKWPNVCDGLMWQTPLLSRLGLSTVPGNIVADAKGKVVARNLSARLLSEQVKEMLEGKK